MSSEYSAAKGSKLKLKGEKIQKHKTKRKAVRKAEGVGGGGSVKDSEDTTKHGGWWAISKAEELVGPIAIEFGWQTYIKSVDNGLITIGLPHNENDPPSAEEIFTAIRIEDKLAIKSGYDKFIKVGPKNELVGTSDAVGTPELFELVFQDGKLAILGHNGCFLSVDPESDTIVATKKKATDSEFVKLRCQAQRDEQSDTRPTEERSDDIRQIEINYVKKFQKFQDKRMRLSEADREEVKIAKKEGSLHEALLDRRSKMKADRYCK